MMEHILNFFLSNAHAEAATPAVPAAQQGGGMSLLLMFVIFFVFIYFSIWRPQNKRARETQTMLSALAKGDEVVTAGGLVGRISKLSEQYCTLAIGQNMEIVMLKSSIANVLPKGTIKSIE